ncbi:HAD-superfamily phosphatase [Pholiota conissans]|uniref:HAD-superfamily phosphatase n=1 Tax=Pholiota conissans TaxID=109636 RepID=A0A9P5Z0Y1_9AGAR|nr:HAD-superfamily phosphatase [Pholiota conissans]
MPLNIPGILVPFQLLFQPRLVIPSVIVKDIRHIDFAALKRAGYRGAVFDKDNCLTIPHEDTLVPELRESWKQCREIFGENNVLIVSNSAGTYLDAGGLQSESVGYHLGVPVLQHKSFKPAYSCITAIRTYFSSLRSPILDHELVIVGDRVFTDVVLANRMGLQAKRSKLISATSSTEKETISTEEKELLRPDTSIDLYRGPLSIWTTGVWKKESMLMRLVERELVKSVEKWSTPPAGQPFDGSLFVKEVVKPAPPRKSSLLEILTSRLRRT